MVIHGFVFPVAGPTQFIDSFGFPRMPGTEYEHWHEGTDIMTAAGTELVACERGVVTRMGTNVLGGIALWLRGESGVSYYYAHLSGYAPGVGVGMVVEAGHGARLRRQHRQRRRAPHRTSTSRSTRPAAS